MPRTCHLLLALSIVAPAVHAQDVSRNEVGILLGLTVLGEGGSSVTTVGVPAAGGALGPGALYAARIMRPWILEFHVSLNHVSGGGTKFTQVYFAVQADYLLPSTTTEAPYVFANVGDVSVSGDVEGRETVAGGGLGYRLPLDDRLAVRFEARYRRWLDSSLNEFGLLVGGGVRF